LILKNIAVADTSIQNLERVEATGRRKHYMAQQIKQLGFEGELTG
jgi:hypothetical protein